MGKIPESNDPNPEDRAPPPKKHVRNKFINALGIIILVPGFIVLLFYGSFLGITFVEGSYVKLKLSLLLIAVYFIIQSVLAIVNNNYYIPKLKKGVKNLPRVGIQVIGRG